MGNPAVPVPHETILATWGTDVVSRIVGIYADVGARDQAMPLPEAGQVCFVTDLPRFQVYTVGGWVTVNEDYFDDRYHRTGSPVVIDMAYVYLASRGSSAGSLSVQAGVATLSLAVTPNGTFGDGQVLAQIPMEYAPGTDRLYFAFFPNTRNDWGVNQAYILAANGHVTSTNDSNFTDTDPPYRATVTWVVGAGGIT